jgi:hypothetical protein
MLIHRCVLSAAVVAVAVTFPACSSGGTGRLEAPANAADLCCRIWRSRGWGVFAADSKVTTRGFVGFEEDHGVGIASSSGRRTSGRRRHRLHLDAHKWMNFRARDAALKTIVDEMVKQKRDYWSATQVVPDDWPGPALLLVA